MSDDKRKKSDLGMSQVIYQYFTVFLQLGLAFEPKQLFQ